MKAEVKRLVVTQTCQGCRENAQQELVIDEHNPQCATLICEECGNYQPVVTASAKARATEV